MSDGVTIGIPGNEKGIYLRISDMTEEYVRGVDAVAMRFYEQTSYRPALIRVPWDWGGALYAQIQRRYNFGVAYPTPLRLIRVLEGNELHEVVSFAYPTRVGDVEIQVTPGLAMPQVYGETR